MDTILQPQPQPCRTNSQLVYFLIRIGIEFAFDLGPDCFSSIQSDKRQSDDGPVVVAYFAERSLPTPVIRGSNPNISIVLRMYLSGNCYSEKTKMKKKEARNGQLKKDSLMFFHLVKFNFD